MRMLRIIASAPNEQSTWLSRIPELSQVLRSFGLKREQVAPKPVSVYRADTELEEMEAVAAFFSTAPTAPEKRFGIILTDDDCLAAQIKTDPSVRGGTGIQRVDARHVNLQGDVMQFGRLMGAILQKMWEGEQRLRYYPAQQIAGQLAVFSAQPNAEVHPDTKQFCRTSLERVNWIQWEGDRAGVVISGRLEDREAIPIVARRACSPVS
jgi:hypothetical protein